MNKKLVVICLILFSTSIVAATFCYNYYTQLNAIKKLVETDRLDSNKKKDLYEQIILQYELMDFKIFAFEKKYAEFAKIISKTFEEARKNKLSPYTVLSVIQVESNFDPEAKSSVAHGLMQINLGAWRNYFKINEKKILDIDYNIELGCKILRHYLDETRGDLARALYLYNNGYAFHNEKYVPKVQGNMFSKMNK